MTINLVSISCSKYTCEAIGNNQTPPHKEIMIIVPDFNWQFGLRILQGILIAISLIGTKESHKNIKFFEILEFEISIVFLQ